jgi:hypothetical protein
MSGRCGRSARTWWLARHPPAPAPDDPALGCRRDDPSRGTLTGLAAQPLERPVSDGARPGRSRLARVILRDLGRADPGRRVPARPGLRLRAVPLHHPERSPVCGLRRLCGPGGLVARSTRLTSTCGDGSGSPPTSSGPSPAGPPSSSTRSTRPRSHPATRTPTSTRCSPTAPRSICDPAISCTRKATKTRPSTPCATPGSISSSTPWTYRWHRPSSSNL